MQMTNRVFCSLQVFDLTRLRGKTAVEIYTADALNTDFGSSHNIVANAETNFIYVVGARQAGGFPLTCAGEHKSLDLNWICRNLK